MKIIVLETAVVPGSVALAREESVVWAAKLAVRERSAESLASRLDAGLRAVDWSVRDIGLVGVTAGPGSFTGLRVGVTAAKILAYTAGCPVAPIDTMQAIAAGVPHPPADMLVVMDAQRRGLLCQRFCARSGGTPRPAGAREIWSADRVLAEPLPTMLVGPGLTRLADRLEEHRTVPSRYWEPEARSVARLAWEACLRHDVIDAFRLVPDYGTMSAAEEIFPRKS